MTISALDWCSRMGIAVAFLGSDSRLINCLLPDGPHDGPVKRAQAISAVTEDGQRLARWLLGHKLRAQIESVGKCLPDVGLTFDQRAHQSTIIELNRCLEALERDTTLDALLAREGMAAQLYWRLLAGTPLPWPSWTHSRVPDHWLWIWPRESGGRSRVRDARDPFNAILNYCYTLLEVETRVACAAHGLDSDLGLLHVDDRLRESFVLDLLEPLRAHVDLLVLQLIKRTGLRPYMFHELRHGVVRLDPDLAKSLAQHIMPQLRRPAMDMAAQYAVELRRIKVPYRLQRFTAGASGEVVQRAGMLSCEYCKQPLPRKGLKFCGRHCYLRHSVEVRQPLKLAQAKLAELRSAGFSPGHGGEAAKNRGAKLAESNRRRALNLTTDQWRARRAAQARARRRAGPIFTLQSDNEER
jgi:CRISPR-associated endonuclease Cas1